MTQVLAPDGEKIVGKYLRSHAALVALGSRVVGKTPDDHSTNWVRCVLLDMQRVRPSKANHLYSYLFQLDCYAGATGGQPEANSLGLTVRSVLERDLSGPVDGAVVSDVDIVGFARIPDTDFEPARERVTITVDVRMHP